MQSVLLEHNETNDDMRPVAYSLKISKTSTSQSWSRSCIFAALSPTALPSSLSKASSRFRLPAMVQYMARSSPCSIQFWLQVLRSWVVGKARDCDAGGLVMVKEGFLLCEFSHTNWPRGRSLESYYQAQGHLQRALLSWRNAILLFLYCM